MRSNLGLFILLLCFSCHFLNAQNFDIFVSDAGNFQNPPWQILKFDMNGKNGKVFTKENLAWPQDILILQDSNTVLISNLSSGFINKHELSTGAYIGSFAGGISGPTRMKFGKDKLLYVLQWSGNGQVLRYNLDGSFVDEYTNVGVPQSIGIDWDMTGNLYVSSYTGGYVRKYNTDGISQGNFVSGLAGPTNILFRANGDLIVLDYNAGDVKLYDAVGNSKGIFITGLSNPEGISILPNGNILIGNGGTGSVKIFDSNGQYIEDVVTGGSMNLLTPNAVVTRIERTSSVEDNAFFEDLIRTFGDSKYYIDAEYGDLIDSISIIDFAGRLIKKVHNNNSEIWDSSKAESGIYIIQIELVDGRVGNKKISVVN